LFKSNGKIQIHDFVVNSKNIEEEIFIKFRSDIFLTKTSQEVIFNEIEKVKSNQVDIVFLGTNIHNDYNQTYKIYEQTRSCPKINDFIIIARTSSIVDYEIIKKELIEFKEDLSGNVYFHLIVRGNTRASNVSTQIYLVRNEPNDPNNIWEIYHNWAQSYVYTATNQYNWIRDNRKIFSNQFSKLTIFTENL
ncbi:hypothetical protein EBU71_20540, partial [bacterium]|nr:hypothetical protein [Candidatus Elulimicrobium humile]